MRRGQERDPGRSRGPWEWEQGSRMGRPVIWRDGARIPLQVIMPVGLALTWVGNLPSLPHVHSQEQHPWLCSLWGRECRRGRGSWHVCWGLPGSSLSFTDEDVPDHVAQGPQHHWSGECLCCTGYHASLFHLLICLIPLPLLPHLVGVSHCFSVQIGH